MLILNTGGTFNKRYNPVTGELEVPYDNRAVEQVLSHFTYAIDVAGAIHKDSLEMTADDRKMMADILRNSEEERFVIVHGTDTMHLSAEFLHEALSDKVIVFTGAMVPFSIDPVEATANLSMAIAYANMQSVPGAYICMQGIAAPHDHVTKNRIMGRFELL